MRTLYLKLTVDWEDYDDVDPQLILEDAIRETAEGVSITVVQESELREITNNQK